MKRISLFLCVTLLTFTLFNCSNDDDQVTLPLGDYENGIFIVNEGGFMAGNGALSFLNTTTNTLINNVYNTVNNSNLGDTAQSATIYGDHLYIIVNGSNRIIIVNRFTLEEVAVIENTDDLHNPRYMAVSGTTGYVTNWGDGFDVNDDFITIIDLESNTIQGTISVAEGPERIVAWNNALYILHQGGFGQGNTISVINPNTDSIDNSINIGDVPHSFQIVGNELFVLCRGRVGSDFVTPETEAEIYSINTSNTPTLEYDFEDLDLGGLLHAIDLNYSNGQFFVQITTANSGVYQFSDSDFSGISKIIDQSFYELTLVDSVLYGMDAGDFASAGTLNTFNLSGNEMDTFTTSVNPGFVLKNE